MTVTNTGGTNLTISTVTLGGMNASDFATSADTCTGVTLTPNGTMHGQRDLHALGDGEP